MFGVSAASAQSVTRCHPSCPPRGGCSGRLLGARTHGRALRSSASQRGQRPGRPLHLHEQSLHTSRCMRSRGAAGPHAAAPPWITHRRRPESADEVRAPPSQAEVGRTQAGAAASPAAAQRPSRPQPSQKPSPGARPGLTLPPRERCSCLRRRRQSGCPGEGRALVQDAGVQRGPRAHCQPGCCLRRHRACADAALLARPPASGGTALSLHTQ